MDVIKGILAVLAALLDKLAGDDSWLKSGVQDMLHKLEDELNFIQSEREEYREKFFAETDRSSDLRAEITDISKESDRHYHELLQARADLQEAHQKAQNGPLYTIMLMDGVGSGNIISCINALREGRTFMNSHNKPEFLADTGLKACKERIEEVRDQGIPVLLYEGRDQEQVERILTMLNKTSDGMDRQRLLLPTYTVSISR